MTLLIINLNLLVVFDFLFAKQILLHY